MKRPAGFSVSAAFTLVELLAVVAVIAVLGALLLPALGQARRNADRTACASHLQQIGAAILLYAAENDQTLPGPLSGGQGYTYRNTDQGQLIDYIATYLDLPAPTSKTQSAPIFLCPAWRRQVSDPAGRPYKATSLMVVGTKNIPVFGYPASGGSVASPPARLGFLSGLMPLSGTAALTDLDHVNTPAYATPVLPIHGEVRNVLYLDGHVGPVAAPLTGS